MRKILGICTLLGVFLLSACGMSDDVVECTVIDGGVIRAYHEEGEITSFVMIESGDISDYDDETIEFMTATLDSMPEATYTIEGDILTMTMVLEGEAIQTIIPGASLILDEFIASAEDDGATCEAR